MSYLIDDEAWNYFQRHTYRICSSDGTEVFATIRDFDEAKTFATDYCNSHPDIDAVRKNNKRRIEPGEVRRNSIYTDE